MRTGAITLSIDSTLDDVFLVGMVVNTLCADVPLIEDLVYQTELAVVEAVNNAIEHGYGGAAGHRVDVQVTVEAHRLTFAVIDRGRPLDWEAVRARGEQPPVIDDLAEGGRGLFIMQAVMDEVRYERVGETNVLTLVRALPPGRVVPG